MNFEVDQFTINVDLCFFLLDLTTAGTGQDRNFSQQDGAHVDNCIHIKPERAWEVILDRKE